MKHLVLGGARSGKSRYAEACALALGKPLVYVATAQARDTEMTARIAEHKTRRSDRWTLVEEPLRLAQRLDSMRDPSLCIVVDCLTLWLSNCLERGCWNDERTQFLATLNQIDSDIILVGNEVGSGIVPMGELSRTFTDENGWLHQELAQQCSHVTTVIAGLPLSLKEPKQP